MARKRKEGVPPRFRQSFIQLLNADVFSEFLKKHPEHSELVIEKFREIIETYNGMLQEVVINEREGIELPEGLGYVFVGSCKPSVKENVDRYKSAKLGTKVMNRNLATDGYVCKIFYTNYEGKFRFAHRNLWKFKGVRQFTRELSKIYREDWQKYIMVEEYTKISSLIRRYQQEEKRKRTKELNPIADTYQEFELD